MKKLIIVCEEKLRHFGDFLAQLISLEDDKNNETVGVKDGIAVAQVWTEKEYSANAVQISSEQYILFVGSSKLIKEKRKHMHMKFSMYGMQYGWLGKQGVLYVEKVVLFEDYDSFFEYAKVIQPEITKLIETKLNVTLLPETNEVDKTDKEKGIKKLLSPMKSIPPVVANAQIQVMSAFAKVKNNKKIEEQGYSCLVLLFYLNGLSKFLGISEE